jgi:negative regulator of replication initiation
VNPEALEAGKERYEAREDFVIVLRVLSRDEIQGYAEVTERIRGWFAQYYDCIIFGTNITNSCSRRSRRA